jgi:hypothetical protein
MGSIILLLVPFLTHFKLGVNVWIIDCTGVGHCCSHVLRLLLGLRRLRTTLTMGYDPYLACMEKSS